MQWHIRWLVATALVIAGSTTASSAQSAPLEARRTLVVGGERREYVLYLPSTYHAGRAAPLVLVFHGAGGRAQGMATHTGFGRLAEREGFAVAYPQGIRRRWNDGRNHTATHDDVGFMRALLDTLRRELTIDPRRIYATGISNGAVFTYRLACDLPGVLAAVAPVAGGMPEELTPSCGRTEPVSVLAIQGTADRLMPYAGGDVGRRRGPVLSATRSVGFWAELDGCTATPGITLEPDFAPDDGTRVRRTVYGGCRDDHGVELYTVEGGGHTWPGGPPVTGFVGKVSRDLDATEVIWGFFAHHPRP